jgi:hypothetical protein
MAIDRRLIDVSQKIRRLVNEALDKYVTSIELRNAVGPAVDFACMSLINLFCEERLVRYLSILSA